MYFGIWCVVWSHTFANIPDEDNWIDLEVKELGDINDENNNDGVDDGENDAEE